MAPRQPRRVADLLPLRDGIAALDISDTARKQSEESQPDSSGAAYRFDSDQRLHDVVVFMDAIYQCLSDSPGHRPGEWGVYNTPAPTGRSSALVGYGALSGLLQTGTMFSQRVALGCHMPPRW